jgi:hypothetical protein
MIPQTERNLLDRCVTAARDLGSQGMLRTGMARLRMGLARANGAGIRQEWGDELLAAWETACEEYHRDYPAHVPR